ncbi:hypothetical protein GCM10010363_40370 [Streptomyces omiyaensis]|uniref:hypothetical protein n=1 Tax=Streptomyces omiyaensis TaxID=68247 RepID=UPI001671B965|nr:hypothetical protein [Streptomyces omiyaensis]GGY54982.1 hypothetical protein GCM10010363_40370 [Streptomyces omiyaensis]
MYAVPGALALLLAAVGAVTLRSGWVPPWPRHRVRRVALHGRAQLVTAASFALRSAAGRAGEPAVGSALGLVALLALLAAPILLVVAPLGPRADGIRARRVVRVIPAGGPAGRGFESGHGFLRQAHGRLPETAPSR